MLMMLKIGPFRERGKRGEREREQVKVTGEWRKKGEFHGLFFGLWIVLFPCGIHPY